MSHKFEVVFLTSLSCLVTLYPLLGPLEGLWLTAFAPFPLVVLGVRYSWYYVLAIIGFQAGVVLSLGRLDALLLLGQYSVVTLVLAGAIRRGVSLSQSMLWSLAAPVACAGLALLLYSLWTQQAPYQLLVRHTQHLLETLQAQLHHLEQMPGEDEEQLAFLADLLPHIPLLFPGLLVISHLFTNVLNYVLVRSYCLRHHPTQTFDPPDLACWQSSDYLVWVFLASGVATLLPGSPWDTIGENVLLVTLGIYLLQGLAIAIFWGRKLPVPPGMRWLLMVLLFLVAGPYCILVCTIVGLFDLWVDFRRQRPHSFLS